MQVEEPVAAEESLQEMGSRLEKELDEAFAHYAIEESVVDKMIVTATAATGAAYPTEAETTEERPTPF